MGQAHGTLDYYGINLTILMSHLPKGCRSRYFPQQLCPGRCAIYTSKWLMISLGSSHQLLGMYSSVSICISWLTELLAIRDLSPLAKQGVLWLNTSLTVRAHAAGSHSKLGWSTFTAEVIRAVISRKSCQGVVFLAWGLPAQKTCQSIGIDKVRVSSSGSLMPNTIIAVTIDLSKVKHLVLKCV